LTNIFYIFCVIQCHLTVACFLELGCYITVRWDRAAGYSVVLRPHQFSGQCAYLWVLSTEKSRSINGILDRRR